MSKIINIGEYIVSIDSIVCIHRYEIDKREYLDDSKNKGSKTTLLNRLFSIFKKETYDGHEVYYDYFGDGYILRGTVSRMNVFLSNGKEIDSVYDESVVSLWNKNKQ